MNFQPVVKFFIFLSLVSALWSPRAPIFGFFFQQEFLFQIFIEIALILFLFSWVANYYKTASVAAFRFKFNKLDLAVIIFFLALILTAIFSVNPWRSFFGTLDRMNGLFSLFHFGILYFLIRAVFDSGEILKLTKFVSFTVFIAALWAIFQKAGIIDVQFYVSTQRPVGSFVNPAFLANYLIFGVFIALFSFLETRSYFYLLSALTAFIGIFITETRGAILGSIIGLLILSAFFFFDRRSKPILKRISALILFSVISVLIFVFLQLKFSIISSPGPLLTRFTEPSQLMGGLRNRFLTWEIALKAFKEHPFLGWGPENFNLAFDKHFNTAFVREVYSETWFDRAHNIFLDNLAANGIVGLSAFIFLLAIAIVLTMKKYRENQNYIIFPAMFASYLISGLVIFDSFWAYVLFFFSLALISLNYSDKPVFSLALNSRFLKPRGVVKQGLYYLPSLIGLPILIIAIIYSLIFYNFYPSRALAFLYQGWQLISGFDEKGFDYYQKSFISGGPYAPYSYERFGLLILKDMQTRNYFYYKGGNDFFQKIVRFGFEAFEPLEKKHQLDSRFYYIAGRFGNFIKGDLTQEEKEKILRYLEKTLLMGPNKPDFYFELAQFYKNQGDPKRAIDYLKEVIAKDDQMPAAYVNLALALVSLKEPQFKEAIESFEKAFSLGYQDWKPNVYLIKLMIEVYAAEKHYERLTDFYRALIELEPTDVQHYTSLAAVYKELGDYQKAKEYALKAVGIDPTVKKQADYFISTLSR